MKITLFKWKLDWWKNRSERRNLKEGTHKKHYIEYLDFCNSGIYSLPVTRFTIYPSSFVWRSIVGVINFELRSIAVVYLSCALICAALFCRLSLKYIRRRSFVGAFCPALICYGARFSSFHAFRVRLYRLYVSLSISVCSCLLSEKQKEIRRVGGGGMQTGFS